MPDLAGTVILLGFLQGAVMVGVLVRRPADQLANRFLAALVGAVAGMLLLGYMADRWGFHGHPHLIALGSPLPFLFGPLLYLYIAALTRPIARFDPRFLAHGLLFVANVLYMLQAFYLKTGDEKLAIVAEYLAGRGSHSARLMDALKTVQGLAYVLASFLALKRYGHKIEGYFSDLTRIDLGWLMRIVLAHAVVWSLVLASDVVQALGMGGPAFRAVEQVIQVGSALIVFLTGYVSLWQPEVYQKALAAQAAEGDEPTEGPPGAAAPPSEHPAAPTIETSTDAPTGPGPPAAPGLDVPTPSPAGSRERPKYQRNRLDDREAEEFARKLRALMEREQAFRDAALTLPVLADTLGTTPHQLSQVLNVRVGRSFYDFVNSYRTEALKAALSDPAHLERGVLELGLEVGFNSKSSLNSFFKRHTGVTPTEFRRRAQPRGSRAGSADSSARLQ